MSPKRTSPIIARTDGVKPDDIRDAQPIRLGRYKVMLIEPTQPFESPSRDCCREPVMNSLSTLDQPSTRGRSARRPSLRRHLESRKLEARRDRAADQRPVAEAHGGLPGMGRHDRLRALPG